MTLFRNTSPERVLAILGQGALDDYTRIFEAIRAEYHTDVGSSVAQIIQDWREFRKAGKFLKEANELIALLNEDIDLGLIHLLLADGVSLESAVAMKYSGPERLAKRLDSCGFAGIRIPAELSDEELHKALEHVYRKLLLPVYVIDEDRALGRVSELRRTNPQMHALVKQITHYNLKNLLGQSSAEVVKIAPLLADLMGMDDRGQIDFATWAGDQEAFHNAAETLFLVNLDVTSKKVTKADEQRHFSHVKDFGRALSALPAQVFVLKGEDPKLIMEILVDKLSYLYTHRHGAQPYVLDLAVCHAKMAFLPFPRLWPTLGIRAEDFLGLEIGTIPEHDLPLENNMNNAWIGLGHVTPMAKVARILASEGIDLGHQDYALRIGYAAGYNVDAKALPAGKVDKMIELGQADLGLIPNVFTAVGAMRSNNRAFETIFNTGLTLCTRENAIRLLVKVLHDNKTELINTYSGEHISSKPYIMRLVRQHNEPLFTEVFDAVLALKKPKPSIINEMLKFGNPSLQMMEKLPESKLAYALENSLGL
ncbi:hypothetical protein RBE51_22045 [Pseudomonas taiwanensis]|uniref:hypothetical protein n=1 Tax=Pseudomonas taiwanensis TaxID=470150 RepID=UPI0028E08634|nr:hypothetical protein [Pseudomonas taiwanensis]MDT8925470.1 hypothetical protein [Pseudomonas taiwanensis]